MKVTTYSFIGLVIVAMVLAPSMGYMAANGVESKVPYVPRLPPVGSMYEVSISGKAMQQTTANVESFSADLRYNVSYVKDYDVPVIYLDLLDGSFELGDQEFELSRGSTTIVPVNTLKAKEYTFDDIQVLNVFAKVAEPLPLKTSETPADLLPSQESRSIELSIGTDTWILNYFFGTISRTG